jgi:hypothetical protein
VSLIDSVIAFGKISFTPKDESVPLLPEMSLLFLKEEDQDAIFPWRAVCIDLAMDACGNSIKEAAKNLSKSLFMYIEMETKAAGGSVAEAAKIITRAAFSKSKQKKEYFALYRKAEEEYIIKTIDEKISAMVEAGEQRQEKLKSKKGVVESSFNRINDVVWQKINTSSSSKRETPTPAPGKIWNVTIMPNKPSTIPAQL